MFVKVTFNSTTRKFKLGEKESLEAVRSEIKRCFGDNSLKNVLGYFDEENEFITVASNEDWSICIEEFNSKCSGKPTVTINLQLKPASNEEASMTLNETIEAVEIQEDPVEAIKTSEVPSNGKVIEELLVTQETQPDAPEERIIEETPAQPKTLTPERTDELVNKFNKTLNTIFGINATEFEVRKEPVQSTRNESSQINRETELNESVCSSISNQMKEEIEGMIEEKLMNHFHKSAPKQDTEESKPKIDKSVVHKGIFCDGCKNSLVGMVRFKSLVKVDFDLCESCEKNGVHPGPMVRFSAPVSSNPFELETKFRGIYHIFQNEPTHNESEPGRRNHCNKFGRWGIFPKGKCGFKNFNSESDPIKQLFNGFMKGFSEAQPEDENLNNIHYQVNKVLPNISREQVQKIIKENNFTSADDVINYILN